MNSYFISYQSGPPPGTYQYCLLAKIPDPQPGPFPIFPGKQNSQMPTRFPSQLTDVHTVPLSTCRCPHGSPLNFQMSTRFPSQLADVHTVLLSTSRCPHGSPLNFQMSTRFPSSDPHGFPRISQENSKRATVASKCVPRIDF